MRVIDLEHRIGEKQIVSSKLQKQKIIQTSLKIVFLLAFFILLSGYEAANPELGSTDIEFFSAEFRHGIFYHNDISVDDNQQLVDMLYAQRNYFPAWTINYKVNKAYKEFIQLLESTYAYGLLPTEYNIDKLKQQEQGLVNSQSDIEKVRARIALEKTATHAAIKLMEHVAVGIRTEADTSSNYTDFVNSLPFVLNEIIDEGKLIDGILDLQPKNRYYTKLQKALARYIKRAIDDTLNLTPQQIVADTSLLKARLMGQGFLNYDMHHTSSEIASALKAFQKAHILDTTGMLDNKTLEALSISVEDKFYRIALNLDRIRKEELKSTNYVLVNIPEYKLHYHNSIGDVAEFVVVVGKAKTPTPELSSEINRIVANPFWTVTQNIARYEMLPRIKKDPDFLKRNGFTIVNDDNEPVAIESIDWKNMKASDFNYWLRQKNSRNALGVVKFLFPNKHHVYLHDTQVKSLFNKNRRAYSHGCVRVQNPEKLAQLLLNEDGKEDININTEISKKERREIRMNAPVTVHLRYFTCTADSTGTIYFHPDIYAKDAKEIKKLFGNSSLN